ncbi:hypothetical protein CDAR_87981 [Caerostris darwini]|uniref:Secreted protein n=1 Tax=Caerostris darwini TaxID=1538125 RepID=A0AAV4S6B6_9ARAC|nr:hypothetical protein CDAR_87981 [Caerostris darwini]
MKTVRFILLVSLLAGILSVNVARRHCACGYLCKANDLRGRAKIGVCVCNCDEFRQKSEMSKEKQLQESLRYMYDIPYEELEE